MIATNIKDPDEIIDFGFDVTDWRETGDAISSASWSTPDGITNVGETETTTAAAVMTSGGTAGTEYRLHCAIAMTSGRVLVRPLNILCGNR